MKTIETKFGTVYFCDCMNPVVGLPALKDNSIDLCFTDPPYNEGFDNTMQNDMSERRNRGKRARPTITHYEDRIENYEQWSKDWFNQVKRICKWIIFTCGSSVKNVKMWLNIEDPTEIQVHYKPNCASFTHISRFNTYEPVLVYGKYPSFTFKCTAMNIPLSNGFLRPKDDIVQHSSPKSVKLWDYYVKRVKPHSIVDPFVGSGTTCRIAESYGIRYVCYEILEDKYEDIMNNINEGIKIRKSTGKIKKLGTYGKN